MGDLDKAQRELRRWRILTSLHSARPIGAAETLIAQVLDDVALRSTRLEVRQELDYLAGKGLVAVQDEDAETWIAEITADGCDVVEGSVKCPPGITRPRAR